MPTNPIIDAHVHLWDPGFLRYPWLDEVPLLNKPYLMDDFNRDTKDLQLEKMLFVQCECDPIQSEQELAWVSELAAKDRRIKGIIPWAPLELGNDAAEILDRYAKNPLVKGIRRIIQFEPDPDFCLKADFIRGVQLLPAYDLSFDICVSHTQLPKIIELVGRCPEVKFMLDHMGKPGISTREFEAWESDTKQLSTFGNVACKLSGLVTEADHRRWKLHDLKPYVDAALCHFGTERLIFGGDWPVLCQASSYARWVETLDSLLSGIPENQIQDIYRRNAEKFYRI
ncbi:amidohydrolase family protein [Pedobacter psychroterrae]|uniref:Amidohydrolase n=1 Tax=Pedobacter psychroterrae TaxID=2530453 RepID=A0A4R0N9M7_9SPHI|nr:amidohydrolase family protein [Pedobacter psychroterrae]TCC96870.1 amidohydrolase [Pedobacter psychroterrae]